MNENKEIVVKNAGIIEENFVRFSNKEIQKFNGDEQLKIYSACKVIIP